MNNNRIMGLMALGDAFGSLAATGSGRPYQSRALPLMMAQAGQAAQREQAMSALAGLGVPPAGAPQGMPLGPGGAVAQETSSRLGFPIPDAAPAQPANTLPPQIAETARALAAADPQAAMQFVADYRMKAATQRGAPAFDNFKVVGDDLLTIGPDGQPVVAYEGGRNIGTKPNSPIAKLAQDFQNGLIDRETYNAARKKALRDPNGITIGPDGTVQIGGVASTSATQTEAIKGRNAYDSIVAGLDDYEKIIADGGTALIPGKQKDQLLVARRSLQLQMKELFNLGVLNGPDLTLMDQLLLDATDPANVVLDATGVASFPDRAKTNLAQLRKMMADLVRPKLRSAGLGDGASTTAQASPPAGMDAGEWSKIYEAMTPEERALFE